MSTVSPPRSEFPSLGQFLREGLPEGASIGFVSFNQWDFTLAALCDTALAAQAAGFTVTIGLWADRTPLPDPGWTTSSWIARLVGTRARDARAHRALRHAGMPPGAFADPPLHRWRPRHMLPTLPAVLRRADIRALRYDGSGMGRSILQVHPDRQTPIRDDWEWPHRWVDAAMRSYAWVYDQVEALIAERRLDALVVYNGRFTHDQAAAAAARKHGVSVLYYDAGGIVTGFDLTTASTHDWDHLQDRMIRLWERWGDADREAIADSWFAGRQAHLEPGIDVFVGGQEIGHLGDLPRAEQLVVFFSSSGDEIAELDLDWADHCGSQAEALRALATECARRPDTALVVRTHPHMRLKPTDDQERWDAVAESAGADLHIDARSPVDSYALMRAADIVFTYGSTSGVEAAYLDRPVVVMGPSAYDRLGCAVKISDVAQIGALLDAPPQARPQDALPYGLMMMRRGFNYERVTWPEGGEPRVDALPLADAAPLARKLSDARWSRRRQRLLRR